MTNAEKYKLTGIEAYNLSQELGEYLTIEKKAEGVFVSDINSFFARATKPILIEDERVILRNINKDYNYIGRHEEDSVFVDGGKLYVSKRAEAHGWQSLPFDHLFQFIKERRRI